MTHWPSHWVPWNGQTFRFFSVIEDPSRITGFPVGSTVSMCQCVTADACRGLSQWFVCPAEWVCCLSLKQPSREKQSVCHESLCGCAEFSFPQARSVYICLCLSLCSLVHHAADTISPSTFQTFSWCCHPEPIITSATFSTLLEENIVCVL